MEFLTEYGLFLAKTITFVIAFIVIVGCILVCITDSTIIKNQREGKGRIKFHFLRKYHRILVAGSLPWLTALGLVLLPVLWLIYGPLIAIALTLATLVAITSIITRYLTALSTRMANTQVVEWNVTLNNVEVGTILDSDYAKIRHRVFSDPKVYFAQIRNLLRVGLKSMDYCFLAIPVGAFWVFALVTLVSPETMTSLIEVAQGAARETILNNVRAFGLMLAFIVIISVLFHWTFGLSRFGFVNCFDNSIRNAVRVHLGVAADGDLDLFRVTEKGAVYLDEIGFLRPDSNK